MRGTIPTSRHGEGGSGGYTPLIPMKYFKKKLEKKIKKKIIFYAVNFSFIYLHISKFLLTFASQ